MATDVTVDARTDGLKTSGATSLSWNHTITAAMVNPWFLVCCTSATGTAANPTSVKWDTAGVNQTMTIRTSKADGFNNCMTTIAGVSPSSTGTKQARATYAASVEITGGSASFQFVNQTTTYDTATTATSGTTGTSSALNVTSSAHAMVVSCLVENDGSTLAASAGQTVIHNENVGAANHAGISSHKAGAAGTVTMTVTGITSGNGWGHAGVSLIFDGGGGGAARRRIRLIT